MLEMVEIKRSIANILKINGNIVNIDRNILFSDKSYRPISINKNICVMFCSLKSNAINLKNAVRRRCFAFFGRS
jgi:hypothetical protein